MDNFPDLNHDGKIDVLDFALMDEIMGDDDFQSSDDPGCNSGCASVLSILFLIFVFWIIGKLIGV